MLKHKHKKKALWLGIFTLLSIFTYSTLITTFGDKNINIARAATRSFRIDNFNNNVMVIPESQNRSSSEGFMNDLSELYRDE